MKIITSILVVLFLFGCKRTDNESLAKDAAQTSAPSCETKPNKKSKFQMYEASEMTALMEQIYVENLRLKKVIEDGGEIGAFPKVFERMLGAKMTDPTDFDAFFKLQANAFLDAQKLVYTDPRNAKTHFSNAINLCITCHEKKCGGPIARIKTLRLN